MGLRIKLLGQFEIYRNGRSIPQTEWRTEKNKDLLKILALYPDQALPQDWLMESLWPDQDPERSVRNLRGRISEIRRILEPRLSQGSESAYVKTVANGYTLDSAHCRIDAEIFRQCYRQARTQIELDADRAIQTLKRATAIYLGDLLPSDRHKEWTFERREELRRLHLDALRQLTELLYRSRQYDEAIRYGEQALQNDPYDERIYRTLMRSHHEIGNTHAALQLYERCRRALEASDMVPSEATDHLFETMRHQAYRFSEHISLEDQLRTITTRLATERDPEVRWDLMGQQIDHLHALNRHSAEADVLKAAEDLARETEDPGKLGRVFLKWADHFHALGDPDAAERYAHQADDQFRMADDVLGIAEVHFALGQYCTARNDLQRAQGHYEQALHRVQLTDGLRADRVRIRVWTHLGQMAVNEQRYTDGLAYYDQALRLSQQIEDYIEQARLFLKLGSLHYYCDFAAQASVHWEHGRQLARRIGHQELEIKCLHNLAVLKKGQADLASAWGLYETVLEGQERLNDVNGLARSWNNVGILHDALGRHEMALDAFERSRHYSRQAGDDLGVAIEDMSMACVQLRRGRFTEAEQGLSDALNVFLAHDDAWYEIQARYYLGELELTRSKPSAAKEWLDQALKRARGIRSAKLAEHVQAALAAVALDLNRGKDALEWAEAVEAGLNETPPGIDDMRILYRLYRVFNADGMTERAERHLERAHALVTHLASQLIDPKERASFEQVQLYRDIIAAVRSRSADTE